MPHFGLLRGIGTYDYVFNFWSGPSFREGRSHQHRWDIDIISIEAIMYNVMASFLRSVNMTISSKSIEDNLAHLWMCAKRCIVPNEVIQSSTSTYLDEDMANWITTGCKKLTLGHRLQMNSEGRPTQLLLLALSMAIGIICGSYLLPTVNGLP